MSPVAEAVRESWTNASSLEEGQRLLLETVNPFYSPFSGSVLVKAEEKAGKWLVYLQASNEGVDQENERIFCKALQGARDWYLAHGVISWDHKHKLLHDPKYIIGEPLDVAFTKSNETLVQGFLYQKNEIAKSVWRNIESGAQKLGASVGGGILAKSERDIQRIIWDETAITHKPVNDGTLGTVRVIPFAEFAKALMAGSGVDAGAFTGGRALTRESLLMGADKDLEDFPYEEARRLFDDIHAKLKRGQLRSRNEVVDLVFRAGYSKPVTGMLVKFVESRLPERW